MGSGQVPNIADIRFKIADIKKIVTELSERLIVVEPITVTGIPTVEVPNICIVPTNEQVE